MKFFIIIILSLLSLNAFAEPKKVTSSRNPSSTRDFICGDLKTKEGFFMDNRQLASLLNDKCDPDRFVQLIMGQGSSSSDPIKF